MNKIFLVQFIIAMKTLTNVINHVTRYERHMQQRYERHMRHVMNGQNEW